MHNKWITMIMLLFLGIFGVHKFYEGKTFLGLLYLCTGGLFGVGVVIDFVVLLFKPTLY